MEDDAGASGVPRSAARRGRAAGARRAADSAAAPPAREAGTYSAGCAALPVAEAPGSACPRTGADTWGPGTRRRKSGTMSGPTTAHGPLYQELAYHVSSLRIQYMPS